VGHGQRGDEGQAGRPAVIGDLIVVLIASDIITTVQNNPPAS
jgi:hypothetical protein